MPEMTYYIKNFTFQEAVTAIISAGEDVRKWDIIYTASGNVQQHGRRGNWPAGPPTLEQNQQLRSQGVPRSMASAGHTPARTRVLQRHCSQQPKGKNHPRARPRQMEKQTAILSIPVTDGPVTERDER